MICEQPITKGPRKGESARGTLTGYNRHYRSSEPPCEPCRTAGIANSMRWQSENRERVRAADRRYKDAHRETLRERGRQQYAADPAKYAEKDRRWQRANPEKRANADRRRYARRAAASIVRFTAEQLAQRMAFWGNRCWMCRGPFEHVDHVKPLSRGGPHILANLRPACASCNTSKQDSWPLEMKVRQLGETKCMMP